MLRLVELAVFRNLILELLLLFFILQTGEVAVRRLDLVLLLQHHELLLLLEQSLELLLVELVEELLAQDWHLDQALGLFSGRGRDRLVAHVLRSRSLSWSLALMLQHLLGISCQSWHAGLVRGPRLLFRRQSSALDRAVQALISLLWVTCRFPLADGLHRSMRHAEAREHLRLLGYDHVFERASASAERLARPQPVARSRASDCSLEAPRRRRAHEVVISLPRLAAEADRLPWLRRLRSLVTVWPPLSTSTRAVIAVESNQLPSSVGLLFFIVADGIASESRPPWLLGSG